MKNVIRVGLIFAMAILFTTPWSGCGGRSGQDKVEVGSGYPPAPEAIRTADIDLLDGSKIRLEDKKGKVLLVNLWAIWCGPCRFEMPELVKLQDQYRDQGFEIIGLDVDPEPAEDIQSFKKKMGLNYKLGWAERELVVAFFKISGREGIPQSFLINRKGELTGVFFGGNVTEDIKRNVAKVLEKTAD